MINCCTSRRSCVLPESSTCVTLFRTLRIWGNMNRESLNPGVLQTRTRGLVWGWKECGLCQMQGAPRRTQISHQSPARSLSSLTLVIGPLPFIR